MDLTTLISPDRCIVPLKATERRAVIEEMVSHLAHEGIVSDPDAVTEVVWARELERTTGIGEGLAVPHGRCPSLKSLAIALGVTSTPIDFQSFDRKPVRVVVLVLSPPDAITDHIQVLGAISRLMADRTFRRATLDCPSPETLSNHFQAGLTAERAI